MTKVKLSLRPGELLALIEVLEQTAGKPCADRTEAIVAVLLLRLYKKLKEKSILNSKPVKLSIQPETALAFIEYFCSVPFYHSSYHGLLIQRCLGELDRQTAHIITNQKPGLL